MKVKYILAILILSWIVIGLGALFKLTHKPGADMFLTIGFGMEILAAVLAIIKLFTSKRFRDFLNS